MFGSCIIHILYTGVLKLKKNNSGAKELTYLHEVLSPVSACLLVTYCVVKQETANCDVLCGVISFRV